MKKVITEYDVESAFKKGEKLIHLIKGDIVTPLAKDRSKELGIKLEISTGSPHAKIDSNADVQKSNWQKVFIGGDHTGFRIRNYLINILTSKGFEVENLGSYDENSCDYPDYAIAVAKAVRTNQNSFGILVDATGIPSAITANKLKGIRAATCYNEFSAKSAREHNNANILVMGARTLGEDSIKSILETFIRTDFAGGRHQKRLDKISEIEQDS
ncbi:MAG: ribose 5-phosphate isomerase B [Ignavibacteriales bacterium]|nr:MAG: ribose 5-phosphate isomerase B [Ignavibacteriales bacterium]